MRAIAWALVLGILPFAGCLSPDGEDPAEPSEDAVAPAAAGSAAASPAAPAPASSSASTPTSPTGANASAPETRTTSIAWDGSTASAVCVIPAHRCDILQQPESSWNEFSELGVPGRAIRASGVLTWEPATPLTEEMHVFVFSLDETGMPVDSMQITGPSPLAFDVDLSEWTGVDFAYSLHGHHEYDPALIVETSQPFHMETAIVSLVDA